MKCEMFVYLLQIIALLASQGLLLSSGLSVKLQNWPEKTLDVDQRNLVSLPVALDLN